MGDDDVILCDEEGVGHFPLRRKALAGTGGTEDQAVRVFELFSVNHDHVVGERIQAVRQRLAALKKLLRLSLIHIVIDRWEDELDEDEDYEPDEYVCET